ncbi:MAG TPA: hypothetical protein VGA70_05755 [Longimicrobiales bacterium]|jgi:hypothetical protein
MTRLLGRRLRAPVGADTPLGDRVRDHLLGEARDLYVNELEWEYLTDEESMDSGALVELTFPGFLAFVRGLLLNEVMPDALAPAEPRPQVVEDVLGYLATRVVELEERVAAGHAEDADRLTRELSLASRLIDHVLYRLHGLTAEEMGSLEDARVGG